MPTLATRDGTTLQYRDFGSGRPLVLLAGWCLSSAMWDYQVNELADHDLRVIAYDRRGHGRSDTPPSGYDYDTLADDLTDVLDALDLRGVTLVGHSMGGGEVIRHLGRQSDDRVARAVLLAPMAPFLLRTNGNPDGIDEAVFDALRSAWREDFTRWLEDGATGYFALPGSGVSRGLVDWTIRDMLQTPLKVLEDFNRAAIATDLRDDLRRISVPVLVIHGDADESAPIDLTGRRCAELAPHADLRVYEGAPHGLYVTDHRRLNQDLLDFAGGAGEAP